MSDIDWPDPIVEACHPDFHATIRYVGDGFKLWWTDGVTGVWSEVYPTLDLPTARLAVLMRCERDDWKVGFANDQRTFAGAASLFLDLEVS